jgi:hypothetical protein
MSFFDDLQKALTDVVSGISNGIESLNAAARARQEAALRPLQAELEQRGIPSDITGGTLVGRVDGATLKLLLSSDDDRPPGQGPVTYANGRYLDLWFEWTLDAGYDSRVVLRPGNLLSSLAGTRTRNGWVVLNPSPASEHLLTPAVVEAATALRDREDVAHVGIRGHILNVRLRDVSFDALAEQIALVAMLYANSRARTDWMEQAGLRSDGDGTWTGSVDGVAVRVVETRKKHVYTTTVHVPLSRPLPPDTRIERQRKSKEPRSRHRIGDMLLDTVFMGRSSDLPAVRARLAREPARSLALGLIAENRGSRITSDEIVVRIPGPVVGDCRVPDAVALHDALNA